MLSYNMAPDSDCSSKCFFFFFLHLSTFPAQHCLHTSLLVSGFPPVTFQVQTTTLQPFLGLYLSSQLCRKSAGHIYRALKVIPLLDLDHDSDEMTEAA